MDDYEGTLSKARYIKIRLQIIRDFQIKITPEISRRIHELYPNRIAIENYTHSLVKHHLEELSGE